MSKNFSVESKVVDPTPQGNAEERQFNKETWPLRREAFKDARTGGQKLQTITTSNWLKNFQNNERMVVLIDGTFIHTATVYHKKQTVDYEKLRNVLGTKVKNLYYFSPENEKTEVKNFYNYIKMLPNYNLVIKQLNIPENNKLPEGLFKSVAVDITMSALRELYEDESIGHILLISRDPELISFVREIKNIHAKVTIARSRDIATNHKLLAEANYIVNLDEFLTFLDVYKPRRENTVSTVEQSAINHSVNEENIVITERASKSLENTKAELAQIDEQVEQVNNRIKKTVLRQFIEQGYKQLSEQLNEHEEPADSADIEKANDTLQKLANGEIDFDRDMAEIRTIEFPLVDHKFQRAEENKE